MEHLLYWKLWKWAKRRHLRKRVEWAKRKYWRSLDGTTAAKFALAVTRDDGSKRWIELYGLVSTPIQRHRKVRGDYNPFDPADEQYGEKLR